jgi:hypothetical protein
VIKRKLLIIIKTEEKMSEIKIANLKKTSRLKKDKIISSLMKEIIKIVKILVIV